MFVKQLALVSETATVPFGQVAQISAALQKQITRDFGPIWNIQATIDPFQRLQDVPPGYWPIIIRSDINEPGALGFHTSYTDGQPYALVLATDETSVTCSHECLEMLADPSGNRLVAANSIMPGQGRVLYLVEVCDPSEAPEFGYSVNGVDVCDFYTPNFFDPVANPSTRYSFTGALRKPLEVRKDGYISWQLPETGEWWQFQNFNEQPNFIRITGQPKLGQSLREFIDSQMVPARQAPARSPGVSALTAARHSFTAAPVREASTGWADRLHADIERVIQAN